MNRSVTLMLAVLLAAAGAEASEPAVDSSPATAAARYSYPDSRRIDHVDMLHGVRVADPYRWLEDLDSAETKSWVEAQNKVTGAYLSHLPDREPLERRLTELWNYERTTAPFKEGGRYFFTRNDGLQNQNVVYWLDRLDGEPRVLLDPNKLSADGTVALAGTSVSPDGKYFAYGLSSGGSDWQEWHVREVETGRDLTDHLRWVKFSGASFLHNAKGFYYSRYDEPREGGQMEDANYFQKLYYHELGTPQSADELVYHRPDSKDLGFAGHVSEDGRYLVIHLWKGTEIHNGIAYKDLSAPGAPVVELLSAFDASYQYLGNEGPLFWFRTNLDAPRGRVIAIDLRKPGREHWTEVIPQAAETLEGVSCLNHSFVALYLKDAHSQVRIHDLSGKFLRELPMPGIGSVGGFAGKLDDRETFYTFSNYTSPEAIYRYDLATGASTVFRETRIPGFDPARYETRQVFYTSKDGTRVPMFICHKKGLALDGKNPTLLYGYGGFSISLTPNFSVSQVVWMEHGGVYAVPNLRGGGEYGEEWHLAGTKLRKQNVFDDFIAAAEWLIANRYTSKDHLAISGASNGGLLVAASMIQRPDLYGAVIVGVGVLDMLRFHKFTIGWGWVSDYGSPDDPEEFKALLAYSPYHNLKPGTAYPPTLITTADHDDRVVPAHSFKFAAAMQNAQAGPAPVLIRIETRAGHGGGKPTSKKIEEAADEIGFLLRELQPQAASSPTARL